MFGQSAPPEWASISGVVRDDSTGQPVRNAVVTLSTTGADPEDAVARTDVNGGFGFAYIPPGRYMLRADRDGYQGVWLGAENGDRPPAPLELHPGDMRAITLRLKAAGSISGVIMDASGNPVENAQVTLLQRGFDRGKRVWRPTRGAAVDERGRYRIAPVFAGKYAVEAMGGRPRPAAGRSETTYGDAVPLLTNGTQSYPRGARDSGSFFEVAPGQHLDGIDFQLPAEALIDVKIKVNLPEGAPQPANVTMIPRDGPALRMNSGMAVRNEGFRLPIPAGRYLAVASVQSEAQAWRSATEVDVGPPTTELTLDLSPGIDLAGRVDFEGDPKQKPKFRVQLVPGDKLPNVGSLAADVDEEGKFTLHRVPPGIWDINVSPVPRGGYLKSMRLGDYDVLTNEMAITPQTSAPLKIVVSARGGVVQGTVVESQGKRAIMLLAPDGKHERVLSFYGVAASDDGGKFQFRGVTPGRYKIYAFDRMEPGAWQDPEFRKPYRKGIEAFSVAEGETVVRDDVPVQPVQEAK